MAAAALLLLLCSVAIRCSQGAEFAPVGCFVDNTGGVRDLNGLAGLSQIGPYAVNTADKGVLGLNSLTLQLCSSICAIGSFSYFGAQYASECYCGNSYGSQGIANANDCNMACAGNASQICGAGNRNSVYRQIYLQQIGHIGNCLQFTAASRLYLNVTSSSGPYHRSLRARDPAHCILRCDAACQAVLFHQGVCHLLKFPAVPHELVDIPGEFFVRG